MAIDDYRFDSHGRPVHKDLVTLAKLIDSAINEAGGHAPEYFELPLSEYLHLERESAYFNGGVAVSHDKPRQNFIWRGVAVTPVEVLGSREAIY